jgi:hypothetical protein
MTDKRGNARQGRPAPDVSTREKRRKALSRVIDELETIRRAEESYAERVPLNLCGSEAYADVEYTLELLTDALVTLGDAF